MIITILCAGMGKRMMSSLPKPLVPFVHGKSMIYHLCRELGSMKEVRYLVLVIQSRHLALFENELEDFSHCIQYAFQDEQRGTGHAFQVAVEMIMGKKEIVDENVICLNGDTPLIPKEIIRQLNESLDHSRVICFRLSNPYGYGRVIQEEGQPIRIVEEKDCNEEERSITLVNAGIYSFPMDHLRRVPILLDTKNAQGEMYLPDYLHLLQDHRHGVEAIMIHEDDIWRLKGVNSPTELEALEKEYRLHS